MLKVKPHPDYPPEQGRYLRGNDYSPSAVAVILNTDEDKIPPEILELVRAGAESGAALSGTVQTPNIGFEKMICNIVANPNIRWLILAGPESPGHLTGEALRALMKNGVDDKKKIIGTEALHPILYNIPVEFIDRFRKQVTLVDLQFQGDPDLIRNAVRASYQEIPAEFMGQMMSDPGAYPGEPLIRKLAWTVTKPWDVPTDDTEIKARDRAREMMDRIKEMNRKKGLENKR